MKIAVLDFEGTSRVASSRATEIGIAQLNEEFQIIGEFETLIRPPVEPDKSSISIARLSRNELNNAPTFEQVWPFFFGQIDQTILIAHNKIYEENVLSNELKDLGIRLLPPFLCTLEWSRKILGHKVSSHSLLNLCDYLNIEIHNSHEAIADVRATALLLQKLIKLEPSLIDEITKLRDKVVVFPKPEAKPSSLAPRERFKAKTGDEVKISQALEQVKIYHKTLVVLTGTPDSGKYEFGEDIASVGLEYRETPPTMRTAFVVQANNNPGMSKIRKAIELGVPILSEADALLLIENLRK